MCHDVGSLPPRNLDYGDECISNEKEEKTQNSRERNYMSKMVSDSIWGCKNLLGNLSGFLSSLLFVILFR